MSKFEADAVWAMGKLISDFGFSVEDAAAVMGNAGHESGGLLLMQEIKPTVAGSRGGFGWFQWTGPRRRLFEAYCERNKLDPISREANYAYLFVELKGSEKAAVAKTKAAVGLQAKTKAFEMAFERAGVKHYPSRYKWAEKALAAYRSRKPTEVVEAVPEVKAPEVPAGSENWLVALLKALRRLLG